MLLHVYAIRRPSLCCLQRPSPLAFTMRSTCDDGCGMGCRSTRQMVGCGVPELAPTAAPDDRMQAIKGRGKWLATRCQSSSVAPPCLPPITHFSGQLLVAHAAPPYPVGELFPRQAHPCPPLWSSISTCWPPASSASTSTAPRSSHDIQVEVHAHRVFDEIPCSNLVSWNTLLKIKRTLMSPRRPRGG